MVSHRNETKINTNSINFSVTSHNHQEEIQEEILTLEETENEHHIILYNDDINTFDHVINMLISVCDHTPIQAEQCAIIVHYKGKCSVKTGNYDDLKPRCTALLEAGLSAKIE